MGVIQQLIGRGSSVVVTITNRSIALNGGASGIQLLRNGELYTDTTIPNAATLVSGEWVSIGANSTVGDAFEVLITAQAGMIVQGGSDPVGSWVALSTTRGWRFTTTGWFDVEIRRIAGAVPAGSARITIT